MKITARPTSVAQEVRSLLIDQVSRDEAQLIELLGVSNYVAIKTVACRHRPCARLILDDDLVFPVGKICCRLGIEFRRAPFGFVERGDLVPGTHHRGSFVPFAQAATKAVAYFGVTAACAEGAEIAEALGNHGLLGELLGYPPCCVAFFTRYDRLGNDLLPLTISDLGPYPREMNPLLHFVLGYPQLLFHFPCSPHCTLSQQLRRDRIELLERLMGRAWKADAMGRGIAVYGAESGVFLITRHRQLTSRTWAIDEVITMKEETAARLAAQNSNTLRVDSVNRFAIGAELFSGPNEFVAIFE